MDGQAPIAQLHNYYSGTLENIATSTCKNLDHTAEFIFSLVNENQPSTLIKHLSHGNSVWDRELEWRVVSRCDGAGEATGRLTVYRLSAMQVTPAS